MLILALLACATAIEGIAAGDGVAVCVAGQARTLNASAVYRNIHESMVRPLRDARHRVDVFLALAPTEGPGFDYASNPLAPELVARLRPVALGAVRRDGRGFGRAPLVDVSARSLLTTGSRYISVNCSN